jgi:hypothetical protein
MGKGNTNVNVRNLCLNSAEFRPKGAEKVIILIIRELGGQ